MNNVMPLTIQEATRRLQHYGYRMCTETLKKSNKAQYPCAFERIDDPQKIRYECTNEDDLLALLELVETSK